MNRTCESALAAAMSALSPLLFLVIYLTALAAGQDQAVLQPTSPAPAPTALAGGFGYSYIGCWNETDGYESSRGRRALAGGRYVCVDLTASMLPYQALGAG